MIADFIRELNESTPPCRSPKFCSSALGRRQNLGDPLAGAGLFNSSINSE